MYDTIPHDHTYVASDILLTFDCSDNICGCHLLHALCNHPFNKPLHPPGLRPSPFLSILWKRKGDHSDHIYVTLYTVRVKITPSVRANARPFPPAVQLRWQGERCISNDISRYKRNIRVSRMDVNRVGPCVRPQSTKYTRIHFDKTVKTP